MGALKEVLYDHIGREYPRLNKYLDELAALEGRILRKEGDVTQLKSQLDELKKNKSNHPYILKLEEFKKKEKEFLSHLANEKTAYANELSAEKDQTSKKFKEELFQEQKKEAFYDAYKDFDYEAKLNYEVAKLKEYHLPLIVKFRKDTDDAIAKARASEGTINPEAVSRANAEYQEFEKNQREKFNLEVEKLKNLKNEKLISAKALANGTRELKQEMKSALTVKKLQIPDLAVKEQIATHEFNLKSQTATMVNTMNKDIADVRRKTPVEKEPTIPWKSIISAPFPGLGQILNGQLITGLLFLIGTVFIYTVAVPYALGYNNFQGNGLRGLYTLAEGGRRLDKSQIYMIEGILAIALLVISLAIIIVSFRSNWKVENNKNKGIREQNWFETKTSIEQNGFPYLVTMPALIVLIFIVLVPIATTILLSFTNMDPQHQSKFTWIGLDNYMTIFQGKGIVGKAFWNILSWTIIWTLVATTLLIIVGFALSLIANNPRIKGKAFFRTVYLLPWAVPAFVTIMFFSLMMAPGGVISNIVNSVYAFFGGVGDIRIKSDTNATRIALISVKIWLGSAYIFLLSTGVLQAIPEDLYEAAQIDGASAWQKVSKITLPLVLFQTAPLLVNQYTFNFNDFGIITMFNNGGPFDTTKYGNLAGSSDLLISYIYKLTMSSQYQSLAAAVTMLISLALMFFAFIGFRNSKAFKEEKL
ncbi:MAG: ABC transporter permease subunit [Clostridiaceae bacterium]